MFFQVCVCLRGEGGLPQCILGYIPPCQADPPARVTPLSRRPLAKETPPPGPHPRGKLRGSGPGPQPRGKLKGIRSRPTPKGEIEGDQIQAHTQGGNWGDQVQAHSQGVNWGGSDPGPHPRGKLRGIRSRPTPKGKLRGIRSRPTPKGEIQGDQVQANIQVGNSGGSGPDTLPQQLLWAVRTLLECIFVFSLEQPSLIYIELWSC